MKKQILLVVGLGLSLSNTLHAVEPRPIQLGDYEARILVDGTLEHSDNLFRSANNEQSSTIARIIPSISLTNNNSLREIELRYSAEAVKFFSFSDDDYVSQNLGLETLHKISSLSSIAFNAKYTDGNEQRGTGSSEGANAGVATGPTEFTQTDFGAAYTYGNDTNPLGVIVELKYSDIEFDNFRLVTAERDRDVLSLETSLSYKLSAATSAFVDIRYSEYDYSSATQAGGFQLDNDQLVTHVGIAWSATRQTTGRIGIGQTSKDVDAATDSSFGSWDAMIEWKPSQNDIVSFEAVKDIQEPAGTGLFIESQRVGAFWSREISPHWSLNLNASFTDSEFETAARQDDTRLFGAELLYNMTRQLDLSFSYQNEDKDSNQDDFDFNLNAFIVGITLAL